MASVPLFRLHACVQRGCTEFLVDFWRGRKSEKFQLIPTSSWDWNAPVEQHDGRLRQPHADDLKSTWPERRVVNRRRAARTVKLWGFICHISILVSFHMFSLCTYLFLHLNKINVIKIIGQAAHSYHYFLCASPHRNTQTYCLYKAART